MIAQMLVKPTAVLAGFLAAASTFAFGLGLALLPLSFFGTLVAGIGLLGLSPFPVGVVLARRAREAFRAARRNNRALLAVVGFILFVGVCAGVQASALALFEGPVESTAFLD